MNGNREGISFYDERGVLSWISHSTVWKVITHIGRRDICLKSMDVTGGDGAESGKAELEKRSCEAVEQILGKQ